MTLVVLEGPSRSGKSTVRDALIERNPRWVLMKGENLMRKGFGDDWNDYQRRYHEALHRLYELNPENVIVADRAFTDAAYNSDPQIRDEMKRLYACYGDVYILFFAPFGNDIEAEDSEWYTALDVAEEILEERGSRDMPKYNDVMRRYRNLLKMFPHEIIDTESLSETDAALAAEKYIESIHEDNEHNPDI